MWQVKPQAESPQKLTNYKTPLTQTLRRPQVWMSIGLFFLYLGGEAALGTWIYTLLTESRGVTPAAAGFWTGSYWATFTIGRILAGLFARQVGVNILVSGGLTGALLGSAMMSGTSKRVGEHFAANTIGMQMAATGLGTAVIPGLMGVFARQVSLEVIPWCLLAVYGALLGLYLLTIRADANA